MMGARQEAQSALFYEFSWKLTFRRTIFFDRLTGLSICPAYACIWRRSTAERDVLRLIRN